jgi:hypothetical protein
MIHISFTPQSQRQVEEGLLDPNNSVGHTNKYHSEHIGPVIVSYSYCSDYITSVITFICYGFWGKWIKKVNIILPFFASHKRYRLKNNRKSFCHLVEQKF